MIDDFLELGAFSSEIVVEPDMLLEPLSTCIIFLLVVSFILSIHGLLSMIGQDTVICPFSAR